MISEIDAVKTVADLMMAAARTAPKSMGIDSLVIQTLDREEMRAVAEKMDALGTETGMTFFNTNADHVRNSDQMVLIGVKGRLPLGANCGGCGLYGTELYLQDHRPRDCDRICGEVCGVPQHR